MIRTDGLTDPNASGTRAHAPVHDAGSEEINSGHLRAFVERIELVRQEQANLAEDLKEIYAEVRGNGFDASIIKEIVKIRAQDPDKRAEKETLLELYLNAISQAGRSDA